MTATFSRSKTACTASRHSFVRAWWGCRENPGTWDNGNGAIVTVSVCRHCGCQRRTVSSYCGRHGDIVTYSARDAEMAAKARA